MYWIIILLATSFFGYGAYAQNTQNSSILSNVYTSGDVEASSTEEEAAPSSTPSVSSSPTQTATITPTAPKLSPTPHTSNQAQNDFVYPNARQVSQNDTQRIYESNDAPSVVTDWYKQKITSQGFNARSFVQTSTNGNIKNVLAADNGKLSLKIEITKSSEASSTSISLTYAQN